MWHRETKTVRREALARDTFTPSLAEPRCPTCDQPLPGGDAPSLPASLVAAARLDDASLVLLAFAYLTGALALVSGFAPLLVSGIAFEWKVLAALAGALAGAVIFVSLKYVSEAMRSLADVARSAVRIEERLETSLRSPRHDAGSTAQAVARQALPPGASGS